MIAHSSPAPGSVLNGIYRVDRLIAQGGMGNVYTGVNIETGDQVAIKIVAPHLATNPKMLAKVRAEARLLTLVVHPAVVPYRVFARDPALNAHYIVTDFVAGEVLSDRIRKTKAELGDTLDLLRRLATGLQAIHAVGAIHCDVSPENVLLPGGRVDLAQIIDLGIAKDLAPGDSTVVIEGFAGKLGYAAPEQLGIGKWPIGPWTDVYGTALVILSFVLGRPANMGGTLADAIDHRGHVPPLKEVPAPLRPLLHDMLVPDPRGRLLSMDAVLKALNKIEDDSARIGPRPWTAPVVPRGVPVRFPATGPFARWRASAVGGALLPLVGMLSLTSFSTPFGPRTENEVVTIAAGRGATEGSPSVAPSWLHDVQRARTGGRMTSARLNAKAYPPAHGEHSDPVIATKYRALAYHVNKSAVHRALASAASAHLHRGAPLESWATVPSTEGGALASRSASFGHAGNLAICRRYAASTWWTIGTLTESECVRRGFEPKRTLYLISGDRMLVRYGGHIFLMRNGMRQPLPSVLAGKAHDDITATKTRHRYTAMLASTEAIICRRYDGSRWRKLGSMTTRFCAEQAFARPGTGFVQSGKVVLSRRANRIGILTETKWRPIARLSDNEAPSSVTLRNL